MMAVLAQDSNKNNEKRLSSKGTVSQKFGDKSLLLRKIPKQEKGQKV